MQNQCVQRWSRRQLLGGVTLAGTAGLLGLTPRVGAAEPPPEITKLTLAQVTEAGMIKGSPQKLIAQGIDWRFFNELRKELKG